MADISRKAGYLKGLAEGLKLNPEDGRDRLLSGLVDIMEDIAKEIDLLSDRQSDTTEAMMNVSMHFAQLLSGPMTGLMQSFFDLGEYGSLGGDYDDDEFDEDDEFDDEDEDDEEDDDEQDEDDEDEDEDLLDDEAMKTIHESIFSKLLTDVVRRDIGIPETISLKCHQCGVTTIFKTEELNVNTHCPACGSKMMQGHNLFRCPHCRRNVSYKEDMCDDKTGEVTCPECGKVMFRMS